MIIMKKEEILDIKGPYGDISMTITPCTKLDGQQPVLILAHGFRGSMEGGGRAKYLAKLAGEITHVVRFNFSGSQIITKQVTELEAVIAYAKKRFNGSKIILLGRSMGGCASLIAADKDADVKGLALWATPNDMRSTFCSTLGAENYNKLMQGEDILLSDERGESILTPEFLTDMDQYDLIGILRNWKKRPLLVIHGAKDETVPLQQGQQSFALAGLPKKLVVVPNADHSFTNHGNKAAEEVFAWLEHILI